MYSHLIGSNLLRLVRVALFALLLATAAFAASPAAAAVPGLTPVERSSSFNSDNFKAIDAACPPGKKVIGGGGRIIGVVGQVGLVGLLPNSDNTRFTAIAQENGGTTANWSLTAYAICANASAVPDLVQVVGTPSAHDSFHFKQAFVNCPTGKKLVGMGAQVDAGSNLAIFQMVPRTSSGVTVGAAEVETGTRSAWSVRAVALCVNQNSAIDVEVISGTDRSGSADFVNRTLNCPTGKKVISGGVQVIDAPFGHVVAHRIQPRLDLDLSSITIGASEPPLTGTTADWILASYALCATP